jgi:hypothetical protein
MHSPFLETHSRNAANVQKACRAAPFSGKRRTYLPSSERRGALTLLGSSQAVPHKRLWRFTDPEGADVACELETLTKNRLLLTVKRNGDPVVTETFADKRDALARSVGIYKEMKGGTSG